MRLRTVLFLCCLLVSSQALAQTAFPWNQVLGAEGLSDAQKAVVEQVLDEESCYAGCSDTLATCLQEEPDTPPVKRVAAFVVRRAKKGKNAVEIKEYLKRRAASVYPSKTHKLSTEGMTPSGEAQSAKIKVVVFADFECPYCRIASPALRKLSREWPKDLVMYFKQFPVKSHVHGVALSQAALAADRQGKFWAFHDAMYSNLKFESAEVLALAQSLGLDMERFKQDMQDPAVLERIRKEKREGLDIGVVGTPGIFINGKFYQGIKTYEELKDRLLEEKDIVDGKQ